MDRSALELIDKLIACWSSWDSSENYYLTTLAPSIVRGAGSGLRKNDEPQIVAALRKSLSQDEWAQLPALIAGRRKDKLDELAAHRKRAKALEEAMRRAEAEQLRQQRTRQIQQSTQAARKAALIMRLMAVFERDFLSADRSLAADPDAALVNADEFRELKVRFVCDWANRELQEPIDPEQAAAVAALDGDVQVVARAGSGKTRTLVTRAIFLQKHCGISPRALLLLAFNKKAAEEMRQRLTEALGEHLPHVMTFHALAHALVHPDEDLVLDDSVADQLGFSREIQEVIDEHMGSEDYGDQIRELMLAHFRDDWEHLVDGRFQLTMDEFIAYRRALPRESLRGDYVKSFGEKVIANALFEHGVEYRYERNFRWNGVNYRPDFTILTRPRGGLVIEYFGLAGDADYDEMSQRKRAFWAEQRDWKFFECTPDDLRQSGIDAFVRTLIRRLQVAGIPCRRRSEEEIWRLVRRRALDRFTEAMKIFVSGCRKRNLSLDDLRSMVAAHTACSTAEALFLRVGISVYQGYLRRLGVLNKDDFDGLMWRSVALVQRNQTHFARDKNREHGDLGRLRFVMIDEFQDVSQMFFELLNAIRLTNPDVRFFCVGDNWQAINAFAGSDPRYFEEFARYFHDVSTFYIRTNHRSSQSVVEVGNALMQGRGPVAKPARVGSGRALLAKLDEFRPTLLEQARHKGDDVTPAVLRLCRSFLDRGQNVVMLSRRNDLPWYINYGERRSAALGGLKGFLEHIRSHLPEADRGRVSISTAHGYKGLEHFTVIVLDAVEGCYPLIHPNWVFNRVFGDSVDRLEEEERRLLYVAITRARDSLVLLTEQHRLTPYLIEIQQRLHLTPLSWSTLPTAPSPAGARLEIRVHDAFEIRETLKNLGYRWNFTGKYWHSAALADDFSFESLLDQPWAAGKVRVEVRSETGQILHARPRRCIGMGPG